MGETELPVTSCQTIRVVNSQIWLMCLDDGIHIYDSELKPVRRIACTDLGAANDAVSVKDGVVVATSLGLYHFDKNGTHRGLVRCSLWVNLRYVCTYW